MAYVLAQPPTTPIAFHKQADPTRAFFSGLQQFLRVPATGIWDYATHDAFRAFLKRIRSSIEIGEWGRNPGGVAHYANSLIVPAAHDETELLRVRPLLTALGIPNDTLNNLKQFQRSEMTALLTVNDAISDAIRIAEHQPRVGGPQPPATRVKGAFRRADIGLIAMGIGGVVFLTGLMWAIVRRV